MFLLVLLSVSTLGVSAPASPPPPRSSPACVTVRSEVRYRAYGYDHLVHLKNGCPKAAKCTVTTNVNPTPIRVIVPPGKTTTVLTFKGSPARRFTPKVSCSF